MFIFWPIDKPVLPTANLYLLELKIGAQVLVQYKHSFLTWMCMRISCKAKAVFWGHYLLQIRGAKIHCFHH